MKLTSVSLALLLAFAVGLEGCSKKAAEKKKDSSGESNEVDDDPPPPSPCLRLQEDEDEDEDEAADEETTVTDETTGDETADDEAADEAADDDATQSEVDESGVGTDTTSADCGGGGGGGGGGSGGGGPSPPIAVPGPGLDDCNGENKLWIPVVGGKLEAKCGEALVDWCCTRAEIIKRFPSFADKLDAKFNEVEGGSPKYKLYNCSAVAGKTSFHFAIGDSAGVHYKTVYAPADAAAGDPKDASCTAVTMADLNLKKAGSEDDDEEADDEEADDEEEPAIPTTIGELTSTTAEGIRTWLLEDDNYTEGTAADWKSDDNIRASEGTSPHGRVKTHHNKKLKDSMADEDSTAHPKGSLAVKVMYETAGSTVKGYLLMGKVADAAGGENWLFYKLEKVDGTDLEDQAPQVNGLNVTDCVTCHKQGLDKDLIKRETPN
jgi:hypothetical protein